MKTYRGPIIIILAAVATTLSFVALAILAANLIFQPKVISEVGDVATPCADVTINPGYFQTIEKWHPPYVCN